MGEADMNYEELVRRAVIEGDVSASDQLIALGELHQSSGRFEDAMRIGAAANGQKVRHVNLFGQGILGHALETTEADWNDSLCTPT